MKYFIIACSPIIFIVSLLCPKNRKVWLYGSWFGGDYKDNSKNLFEYSNNQTDDITHIWIYKNKSVQQKVMSAGFVGLYAYSLKGLIAQLRAKVYICSINSSDFIPFFITPRNTLIQLWHGSPMKHIGLDTRTKYSLRYYIDTIRFRTIDNYDIMVSPSELFDKIYKKAFCITQKNIFRGGYPRNDELSIDQSQINKIRTALGVSNGEMMALYMPTHRNEGKIPGGLRDIVKELLNNNDFYEEKMIKIIVKPHFYEKEQLIGLIDLSNVKIVYDTAYDLYQMLGSADLLITDYSSVVFDFELLGKPMLLYTYDYKEYITNDRKMYFDFDFLFKNLVNSERVENEREFLKYFDSQNKKCESIKSTLFNEDTEGAYSNKIYSRIKERLAIP